MDGMGKLRRKLKERAEDEAFDTFRRNLKKKLLSPPLPASIKCENGSLAVELPSQL